MIKKTVMSFRENESVRSDIVNKINNKLLDNRWTAILIGSMTSFTLRIICSSTSLKSLCYFL